MCGLLAYFSTDTDRVDDFTVEAVRQAQHCLRHRGPVPREPSHSPCPVRLALPWRFRPPEIPA